MQLSYKNHLATLFLMILLSLCLNSPILAQSKETQKSYAIEGSATILSHFVYHGLSQTQKDPSLQTLLVVPLIPEFKVGIWGSNVSYENANNHVWFKLLFDLNIELNKDVQLIFGYNFNKFYKDSIRNGSTLILGTNLFDYQIRYESETNWQGTETGARYVSFGKIFQIFSQFDWLNQIGYSMLEVPNLQNYFDLKSQISTSYNKLNFLAAVTLTSTPSQFNGNGDIFAILGIGFTY